MGLRYTDSTIQSGEKYVYKIYSTMTTSGLVLDTGYVLVDLGKYDKLFPPQTPAAQPAIKRINISWNAKTYDKIFSSWILERSDDGGKTYNSISKKPIVYVKNPSIDEKYIFWSDSVPSVGYVYFYRLKGKNLFGEISPPSVTVSGFAKLSLGENPVIDKIIPIQSTKVKITWKLNLKYNSIVSKFKILIASKSDGTYKELLEVDSLARSCVVDCPYISNYYIVKAIDIYEGTYPSFAALFQSDDITAPATPSNIKWTCDTNGRVLLYWNKNKEADFQCYRIFRSNGTKLEFSNITSEMKADTFFVDSVFAGTLAKKIYYKVIALDFRYNKSPFSETIIVRKPDKIPPAAPVFTQLKATDTSLYFSWAMSESNDIRFHKLMRSIDSSGNFQMIFQTDTSTKINYYADTKLEKGRKYYYKIVAEDEDGNISRTTTIATLKLKDNGERGEIEKFTFDVDRETQTITLQWKYAPIGVNEFAIYRYEKNFPPRLYKSVQGNERTFTDINLRINTTYFYKIKAKHSDGGSSKISKEIEINY